MDTPAAPENTVAMIGQAHARTGLRAFLSYAHGDLRMVEHMRAHLMPLVHSRLTSGIWFDRDLHAGQAWDVEIERAIAGSDIFLLFLSADYLASDYIRDHELPRIRSRAAAANALLISVVLKRCYWEAAVGGLQAVPTVRGAIRPIRDWRPVEAGYRAAAEQILNAIAWHFAISRPQEYAYDDKRRLTDEQIDHAVRSVVGRHATKA